MLETTLVHVGNETYARENDSYGLTTFRAVTIDDRRHTRAIKRCRNLPGEVRISTLDDANAYLREGTGGDRDLRDRTRAHGRGGNRDRSLGERYRSGSICRFRVA